MSQIVWTELEAEPIRWPYRQSVPVGADTVRDNTAKSWSASTTPATQIQNANTGTANNVYAGNLIAQVFRTGSAAIKATAVQLYGRKVGSPPNPLQVEIRKFGGKDAAPANFAYDQRAAGNEDGRTSHPPAPAVIATLSPNLPAGDNVIVVSVSGRLASGTQLGIRRKGSSTYLRTRTSSGAHNTTTFSLAAFDPGAPAGQEYELVLLAGYFVVPSTEVPIKIWALIAQGAAFVQFDNGTTNPLASLTLPAGKWLIIGVATCYNSGTTDITPGPARLFAGTTLIAEGPSSIYIYSGQNNTATVAGYLNNTSSATVSLQILNIAGSWSGELIAIPVAAGTYGRTVLSSALSAGAWATITSASFSGSVGDRVLAVATFAGRSSSTSIIRFGVKRGGIDSSRFFLRHYGTSYNTLLGATFKMASTSITLNFDGFDLGISPNPAVSYVVAKPSVNFWSVEYQIVNSDGNIAIRWAEELSWVTAIEVRLPLYRVGTPGDVTVEIRKGSADGLLRGSAAIPAAGIPGDGTLVSAGPFSLLEPIFKNDIIYIIVKTSGTGENYYLLKAVACPEDTISGRPRGIDAAYYILTVSAVSDAVLASGSIAPASVGTSDAWFSISFGTPIVLRPGEYFVIVVYTVGGDASNYYVVHRGTSSLADALEVFLSSTNAGTSWTPDPASDVSFKLDGVSYVRLYSGSVTPQSLPPVAKSILSLKVRAQTSASMEFAGFDDYTLASPVTSSTSANQTVIEVLRGTDARLREPYPVPTQLRWEIWAAGSGLATRALTQDQALFDKNPVTPRDFGVSEAYVIKVTAVDAGSLLILNDRAIGSLYFPSAGAEWAPPANVRVPVNKLHVLQGRVTVDLLGVK